MKGLNISRDRYLEQSDTLGHIAYPVLGILSYLLFLVFPALICGCNPLEINGSNLKSPEGTTNTDYRDCVRTSIITDASLKSLDIFTFEDDRLQRLDSYQRFDNLSCTGQTYDIASCTGKKILIMLANNKKDKYEWADINCRKSLEKSIFNLENEDYDFPTMTAEHHITAGKSLCSKLIPLTGEVILRSIRCDFSGKSYSGEQMDEIKVYLTNVNACCGIWNDEDVYPTRIINAGRLNESDMKHMIHPELICQRFEGKVGNDIAYPDIRLRAFPNSSPEESIGTPFTRLVIEGKICGKTWYYPIEINREDKEESGLRRNRCYIYDITITSTGLTDPDGAIKRLTADIVMEVEEWKEKDWYDVRF